MTEGFCQSLAVLLALLLFAVVTPAHAHPPADMVGGEAALPEQTHVVGVLDGRRDRVDFRAVTVTINGVPATMDADGHFKAQVDLAPYYRIDIAGQGIFAMVQTFGNAEVRDEVCGCLAIPAIELVARKKGRVELFFAGDSMAGRRYFMPRADGSLVLGEQTLERDLDRLFEAVAPYIQTSDHATLNLESVLAAEQPGVATAKRFVFYSTPGLAEAMARAGIDHVSLGNNHTADYGDIGVETTVAALDAAGIDWSGAGRNRDEAERAARVDLPGNKLALFGMVGWRGNWTPNQVADDTKGGAAWASWGAIKRATQQARKDGYRPIMQLHSNPEYSDRSSELSNRRFRRVIDAGAPVVVGHHPHVVHGLEIYRDGLIAHSLGNFLFDQTRPETQVSYALKVWLEKGRFLRAEAIPLQILDFRPVPAVGGMREASLRRLKWLSAEKGTHLALSGGHAVVWAKGSAEAPPKCAVPNTFKLDRLAPACLAREARYSHELGRNIIPRGDFSNAVFGIARDRYWRARNAAFDIRQSRDKDGYLALLPDTPGRAAFLYSASYIRDGESKHYTFSARIKLPRAAQVELMIKDRPREGDPLTPAVSGTQVAVANLPMHEEWQDIRFEFTRPVVDDGSVRAFRPILRISFEDRSAIGAKAILFDDIELVEWPDSATQRDPGQAWRWTHTRPVTAPQLAAQ